MKSEELKQPRGLRNNNPLNIRLSKDKWQGQRPPSTSSVANGDSLPFVGSESHSVIPLKTPVAPEGKKVFCQFEAMEYGWRAAFRLLCHTYYGKYKLRTIRDIISRWAPPKENNTPAYIRYVSDYTGIWPDRELGDPKTHPVQWLMIGFAMAVMENGTANINSIPMLKGWEMAVQ